MWPLGRSQKPKQFQPLISGKSTFELMIGRLQRGFRATQIFPVVSREYVGYVAQQAPSVPLENIIIEPELRDTFATVGLAAAILNSKFGRTPVVALWSDNLVKNEGAFLESLKVATTLAQGEHKMVEIGVRPTFPSTQLGYIKVGKMLKKTDGMDVFEFLRQIEKPNASQASDFVKSREYLWHVGYAVWETETLLGFYKRLQPESFAALEKIVKTKDESQIAKLYQKVPKVSLDFAILEKLDTKDRLVISADLGWADVGTWDVLQDELPQDPRGLVTLGKVLDFDSKNCLIYETVDGKVLATVALDNLIIVDTPDALLVCSKDRAQDVKKIVEKLKEEGKDGYL